MKRSPASRTGVAAFRPWPFGPPLRGRVPRRNAGPLDAPELRTRFHVQPKRPLPRRQALALAGGFAWSHPVHSVQR
jgi:hypothetical protein